MRIETKIVINSAFGILNKQNGCVPVKAGFGAVLIHICGTVASTASPGLDGRVSPSARFCHLMVLCRGSDHISRWQGTSFMCKTWCCCSVCTPGGEEAAPGAHQGVQLLLAALHGMAP